MCQEEVAHMNACKEQLAYDTKKNSLPLTAAVQIFQKHISRVSMWENWILTLREGLFHPPLSSKFT